VGKEVMARKSLKNVIKLIERANTDVPVEQQFLSDLKRSIELEDIKTARKPSQTYKPSGMNCIRSMYYQVMGAEVEPDSNYVMVGICEAGTDRHERIQNAISAMKSNGFDCEYIDVAEYVKSRGLDEYLDIVDKCGNETKLYDRNRNISFLCDGIIKYQSKYYIVEFKTESSFKWRDRKSVDPKHFNQARTYSLELQLEDVIFIYINRDIVDMKAYMYHVEQSERDGIIDLIRTCQGYVDKQELPPKPDDATDRKCAYCNYKDLCERNDNGTE
jgi:CRISPR/Cas system-associated exonuclease Cas4 (RecB family)